MLRRYDSCATTMYEQLWIKKVILRHDRHKWWYFWRNAITTYLLAQDPRALNHTLIIACNFARTFDIMGEPANLLGIERWVVFVSTFLGLRLFSILSLLQIPRRACMLGLNIFWKMLWRTCFVGCPFCITDLAITNPNIKHHRFDTALIRLDSAKST